MSTSVLFRKMDEICVRMQSVEVGLVFKTLKYFRVSVPASFSGQDVVEWLSRTQKIEDNAGGSSSIRDNNALYRSQIPYFWPSLNATPDDVEYAIYLSKRLLRNEEKHGLSESEAEAFNKTRELLGHMWDFIQSQAEMQLKLFKEKKKIEKVVYDSQEKAYWRVHRPPHGLGVCMEERYGKLEKRIRKKTSKEYHQETERLKFALKTKPWLKSPKAVETLVSWCEQFTEYDSFLTPLKDPSNPWVTDDAALWVLNADNVVPTERRVKRWGFAIQELIQDPIGRQVLETFLESEFSQENIRFWAAVQDLKNTPKSLVAQKVDAIYSEFLAPGASCQVNVDSRTLEAVHRAMSDKKRPPRFCFSEAEEHIFILMSKDSYPRFLRSDIYKGVLNAALQQGAKRVGWKPLLFGTAPNKKYGNVPGGHKISSHPTVAKNSREENSSASTSGPRQQLSADSWIPKLLQRSSESGESFVQLPHASASSVSLTGFVSEATSDFDTTASGQIEEDKHSAPYQGQ